MEGKMCRIDDSVIGMGSLKHDVNSPHKIYEGDL